jgi:S1-C subfamily serine protease
MRSASIIITTILALALMGVGVAIFPMQGSDFVRGFAGAYASEVARQELAAIDKAAPKFPRKPLLPADVKVLLDQGHGSGVHIGNGLYLTAAHVVLNPSKRLDLRFKDGSIRPAEILWISKDRDVALLKAASDGVSFSRVSCSKVHIGDDVTLAGNPMALEDIVGFGKVAGDERKMAHWNNVFVVSGPVIPGQSGGAVYNKDHELIGISVGVALWPLSPFAATTTGYGFVVPTGSTICELLARA